MGGAIILTTALSVSYNMLFYLNYNRLSAGADYNIVAVVLHIASFEASRNLITRRSFKARTYLKPTIADFKVRFYPSLSGMV